MKLYYHDDENMVRLKKIEDNILTSSNVIKSRNSYTPNIIQSIDASILHTVIAKQTEKGLIENTLHNNFIIKPIHYEEFYKLYITTLTTIFTNENILQFFTRAKRRLRILFEITLR